jgi:hypothetical protein
MRGSNSGLIATGIPVRGAIDCAVESLPLRGRGEGGG